MNKKILNNTIFLIIFLFFNTIQADCGSFKIQEDYFADNLIGFYLNSIDINATCILQVICNNLKTV